MPTVREIEQALFRLAPKEGTMDWDNVGQLLGDPEAEVRRVLVALDITEAVADEAIAENCQLIVSHHPVMNCKWLPVQTVRQDTPQGHLLLKILRSGLSAICMHTNLDVAPGGVNDALAAALGLEDPGPLGDPEGLCRMGTLASPMPLQEFAKHVCRALQANGVRYAGDSGPVRKVAVGGGACGDYEDAAIAAGCDVFVTSDLSYHQFLDAAGKGIRLIDAGHFPTENPVCTVLAEYLRGRFPGLTVTKSASHREVIVAVKEGGGSGDPNNNSRLATVIAKAKAVNMPNDNIKRTIDRALGSGSTDNYEAVTYEGYGPGGVAVIVEALTDNRQRTAPEVRHAFDKCNGNLGAQGCVSWSFDKKGVIVIDNEEGELDEDTVMMDALEAGAADFEADGPALEITCDPDAFNDVVKALEGKGYAFASAEIEMVPQNYITLTGEGDVKNMEKLIDMLEDNDDVQNVWHNWDND